MGTKEDKTERLLPAPAILNVLPPSSLALELPTHQTDKLPTSCIVAPAPVHPDPLKDSPVMAKQRLTVCEHWAKRTHFSSTLKPIVCAPNPLLASVMVTGGLLYRTYHQFVVLQYLKMVREGCFDHFTVNIQNMMMTSEYGPPH